MRTKQFIFLILAFGMAGLLTACSDSLDGTGEPMKWKTSVETVKDAHGKYVSVPKEGGTYTFTCKNYDSFWFSDVVGNQDGKSQHYYPDDMKDPHHIVVSSWAQMNCKGRDLIVEIQPNTGSSERTLTVGIQVGNIFGSFRFIQSAGQP